MYSSWLCVLLIMKVTEEAKGVLDYHEHFGIPLATRIKETEDEIHSRPVSGRRIVGGGVSPPNLHPYLGGLIIRIVNKTRPSVCGSTLITTDRLVTAAHCWMSKTSQGSNMTVVLASEFLFTGGMRIVTSNILLHPSYKRDGFHDDIAIISLPSSITFSDSIKPAFLPHSYVNNTFDNEWVIAAGYGQTKSGLPVSVNSVISHVRLQVLPVSQCKRYYLSDAVQPYCICTNGTGGVGICDGDSGGPLVSIQNGEAILVGVTAFAAEGNCEDGYPSVYMRVTSFLPFITENT